MSDEIKINKKRNTKRSVFSEDHCGHLIDFISDLFNRLGQITSA